MPLGEQWIRDLPVEVINELAILEDRALRAEDAARRERSRTKELHDEVALLRECIGEVEALAQELQTHAERLAREAKLDAQAIEGRLRHLLVMRAG
jgi:hypothetical protein